MIVKRMLSDAASGPGEEAAVLRRFAARLVRSYGRARSDLILRSEVLCGSRSGDSQGLGCDNARYQSIYPVTSDTLRLVGCPLPSRGCKVARSFSQRVRWR